MLLVVRVVGPVCGTGEGLDAIDAIDGSVSSAAATAYRRDSKGRLDIPVPVIINHERVVVARPLHLALLDQSV